MNMATAHRFLLTLEATGALASYRRGSFCLGPALDELGQLAEQNNPLAARVQPLITDLARNINESVMVCRLGRKGPVCIAVAGVDRPITVNINVGTVLPMAVTAQGKIWLAHMEKDERKDWGIDRALPSDRELEGIRLQGFAENRGDNEPDIGAVSVPIYGRDGKVALTLSTFGMLSRFDKALVGRALPLLKDCSAQIPL